MNDLTLKFLNRQKIDNRVNDRRSIKYKKSF